MSEFQETAMQAREVRDERMVAAKRNSAGGTPAFTLFAKGGWLPSSAAYREKWCAQGDDFRTFLRGFVASLTVSNFEAGEAVYQNTPFI
jgi:hypothetical protein